MTPYTLHKIVNAQLERQGSDRKIKPQMIYNYVRKNYIEATVVASKLDISDNEAMKFLDKYLSGDNFESDSNNVVNDFLDKYNSNDNDEIIEHELDEIDS